MRKQMTEVYWYDAEKPNSAPFHQSPYADYATNVLWPDGAKETKVQLLGQTWEVVGKLEVSDTVSPLPPGTIGVRVKKLPYSE